MAKQIFKLIFLLLFFYYNSLQARDLPDILKDGKLRHIGVPYANFVTGLGDGLDVELIQGFAKELGVKYVYVKSSWDNIFGDLTGHNATNGKNGVILLKKRAVKGDLIANGLTALKWRKEVVNFSTPTFPSSVWLIAKASSKIKPITPSNSLEQDIKNTKAKLKGLHLLTYPGTCLDASLYSLGNKGVIIDTFPRDRNLIEMIPTMLRNKSQVTLLDVPDALIALQKWSGKIKVIGPISKRQSMGVAFAKDAPLLLKAFNKYFAKICKNGKYKKLVEKYFPTAFDYFGDSFNYLMHHVEK